MTTKPCNTPDPADLERNTRRVALNVRISPAGIDAIDEAATTAGVDRSTMVRAMLGYAMRHLPGVRDHIAGR